MTHPLSSADIGIFFKKSGTIATLKNTDKDCVLMHNCCFFLLRLSLQRLF